VSITTSKHERYLALKAQIEKAYREKLRLAMQNYHRLRKLGLSAKEARVLKDLSAKKVKLYLEQREKTGDA
jgi:hypothetical protein